MQTCSELAIHQLSIDRYRPMFRLLSRGDIEFVRSCPGSTAGQIRWLRRQRAVILLDYLRSLAADFRSICREDRAIIAKSPRRESSVRWQVLRYEWEFARKMAAVRVRLFLFRWGMAQVKTEALLFLFDAARLHLREFTGDHA